MDCFVLITNRTFFLDGQCKKKEGFLGLVLPSGSDCVVFVCVCVFAAEIFFLFE